MTRTASSLGMEPEGRNAPNPQSVEGVESRRLLRFLALCFLIPLGLAWTLAFAMTKGFDTLRRLGVDPMDVLGCLGLMCLVASAVIFFRRPDRQAPLTIDGGRR